MQMFHCSTCFWLFLWSIACDFWMSCGSQNIAISRCSSIFQRTAGWCPGNLMLRNFITSYFFVLSLDIRFFPRLMVDHHIPQENALIWGKNQIIMVVVWGECHYILCKRQTIIIWSPLYPHCNAIIPIKYLPMISPLSWHTLKSAGTRDARPLSPAGSYPGWHRTTSSGFPMKSRREPLENPHSIHWSIIISYCSLPSNGEHHFPWLKDHFHTCLAVNQRIVDRRIVARHHQVALEGPQGLDKMTAGFVHQRSAGQVEVDSSVSEGIYSGI